MQRPTCTPRGSGGGRRPRRARGKERPGWAGIPRCRLRGRAGPQELSAEEPAAPLHLRLGCCEARAARRYSPDGRDKRVWAGKVIGRGSGGGSPGGSDGAGWRAPPGGPIARRGARLWPRCRGRREATRISRQGPAEASHAKPRPRPRTRELLLTRRRRGEARALHPGRPLLLLGALLFDQRLVGQRHESPDSKMAVDGQRGSRRLRRR